MVPRIKEKITQLFFKKKELEFVLNKKALNVAKRFFIPLEDYGMSLMDPLNVLKQVKPLVLEKFKEYPSLKNSLSITCLMERGNRVSGEMTIKETNFNSEWIEIHEESNLDEIYERMVQQILVDFETYMSEGSGWNFVKSLRVVDNLIKIKLLGASSYIPLPRFLEKKKCIINPQNKNDHKCFLWCVAIHDVLKENPKLYNPERLPGIVRNGAKRYNLKGIKFICDFREIDKFEKNNNLSINVFGYYENRKIYSMRLGKQGCELENYINLLYIDDGKEKHFCLIKDLSRLTSSQTNNHQKKKWICFNCLQHFEEKKTCEQHFKLCRKSKCGRTIFPKKGETLSFKNVKKLQHVPFLFYGDWECYLQPMHKKIGKNTTQFQKHTPSGFCFLTKCFDDNLLKPKLTSYTRNHREEDLGKIFMNSLIEEVKKIYQKFKYPKRLT